MNAITIGLRKHALVYLAKIILGAVPLRSGLRAAGIASPHWAIISLIIVTEPDLA